MSWRRRGRRPDSSSPGGNLPSRQVGLRDEELKGPRVDPNKNQAFAQSSYLQNKSRQGIVSYTLRIARLSPTSGMKRQARGNSCQRLYLLLPNPHVRRYIRL